MSRLFPNWLKHLCPLRRAQTWRCHLVIFHQEQAYKKLDFCLPFFLCEFEKSLRFICSLQFGSQGQVSSLQASLPIMAALFSHVTPMQIFLQKGWLNPLFAYLGSMFSYKQQEIRLYLFCCRISVV